MVNPRQIVSQGYDRITRQYLDLLESMGHAVREKYLQIIFDSLPENASILELGCGAGIPMTKRLAERFRVTGMDISGEQLKLAETNVPEADFILADMARPGFPDGTFDAVTAFYSITHVPRQEHRAVLDGIHSVLKPSGLMVMTMAKNDLPDFVEDDWLGTPMFFSHYDGETNNRLVKDAGFEIISAEDECQEEFGKPVCFRWFVARKAA